MTILVTVHMPTRHELMKEVYPDSPKARGTPYTGLDNARPETLRIAEVDRRKLEFLPFDLRQLLEVKLPATVDPGWGN